MPKVHRCRYPNCHTIVRMPDHYCAKHFEYEAPYLESRKKWNHKSKAYEKHYNNVVRNRDGKKQSQYAFYRSKQWTSLRREVLGNDHYMCRYCHVIGKLTYNCRTVDHIVPIEVDSSKKADKSNLATICRSCHRLKTDWEQKYYGTGKNNKLKNASIISDVGMVDFLMKNK